MLALLLGLNTNTQFFTLRTVKHMVLLETPWGLIMHLWNSKCVLSFKYGFIIYTFSSNSFLVLHTQGKSTVLSNSQPSFGFFPWNKHWILRTNTYVQCAIHIIKHFYVNMVLDPNLALNVHTRFQLVQITVFRTLKSSQLELGSATVVGMDYPWIRISSIHFCSWNGYPDNWIVVWAAK